MTELFADPSKFCKLDKNNTLTQLTTLQNYLRTIHNRGEINDDKYNFIRPQSTTVNQHEHMVFLKHKNPTTIYYL